MKPLNCPVIPALVTLLVSVSSLILPNDEATDYTSRSDLYVLDVTTMKQVRLTNDDWVESRATWSPDGKRVVYSVLKGATSRLVIHDLDNGKKVDLLNDGSFDMEPVWIPDGNEIIFTSHRENRLKIFLVNIDGSGLRCLTRDFAPEAYHFDPVVNPDGTKIAFSVMHVDKSFDIEAIDLMECGIDGSELRKLSTDTGWYFAPAWSSDGKRIITSRYRAKEKLDDLVIFDVSSATMTSVSSSIRPEQWKGPLTPAFLPGKNDSWLLPLPIDTSGLVYVLHTMDLFGNAKLFRRSEPPSAAAEFWPVFSPDGKRLLYCNGEEYPYFIAAVACRAIDRASNARMRRSYIGILYISVSGDLLVSPRTLMLARHAHSLYVYPKEETFELRLPPGEVDISPIVATIESSGEIRQAVTEIDGIRLPALPTRWPHRDERGGLAIPPDGTIIPEDTTGSRVSTSVEMAPSDKADKWLLMTIDGVFIAATSSMVQPSTIIRVIESGDMLELRGEGTIEGPIATVDATRTIQFLNKAKTLPIPTEQKYWPFANDAGRPAYPHEGTEFRLTASIDEYLILHDDGTASIHESTVSPSD